MSDEGAEVPRKKSFFDRFLEIWAGPWGKFLIIVSGVISLLIILSPLIAYICTFPNGLSGKSDDWGNFGSFTGGIYGSIISVATILYLVYINKKDREDAQKQAELQERRFGEQITLERQKKENQYVLDLLDRHDRALKEALEEEGVRGEPSRHFFHNYTKLKEYAKNVTPDCKSLIIGKNEVTEENVEAKNFDLMRFYSLLIVQNGKVAKMFSFGQLYLESITDYKLDSIYEFWHQSVSYHEVLLVRLLYGMDSNIEEAARSYREDSDFEEDILLSKRLMLFASLQKEKISE